MKSLLIFATEPIRLNVSQFMLGCALIRRERAYAAMLRHHHAAERWRKRL